MSDDERDGAPVEPAEEAEDNAAERPQIQQVPPIRQSTSITPSVKPRMIWPCYTERSLAYSAGLTTSHQSETMFGTQM
ncbi:unnamed protein product [Heligmosomoides polygyrus]|uniref:Uncharacterized protein n=1 Tax=Heligmosomoides polygyrus TaxID=6339 RepID=A0A183GAW6_HELPZ|nr:unnamed protein product [Heligmosomoides polygyrus]